MVINDLKDYKNKVKESRKQMVNYSIHLRDERKWKVLTVGTELYKQKLKSIGSGSYSESNE